MIINSILNHIDSGNIKRTTLSQKIFATSIVFKINVDFDTKVATKNVSIKLNANGIILYDKENSEEL